MAAASAILADPFVQFRADRIASAAGLVGLPAGEALTDEQLAHLAWHVAAIEPSELRQLDRPARPAPARQICRSKHQHEPDPLDQVLPLPHPLDYEWRYDPRTRQQLVERCKQQAGAHGAIALLGTPTLAPELRDHTGDVLLLDTNAKVLTALADIDQLSSIRWAVADLATFNPPRSWEHRAAVVVCDPPWYPDAFATFLRAAAQLVRPGGSVLLSVPDLLTRPSIAHELNDLRSLASQLQLAVSATEPQTLRYRTPFFEYRALRAADIGLVPLDWRAGTLWQLTSTGAVQAPHAGRHRAAAASTTVTEITINDVRLRILRARPTHPGVLSLQSVVPGDTLPTVSRRHPARSSATLWTSGNTVLSCADPDLTGHFLSHLAEANAEQLAIDRDRLAHDFARRRHLQIPDVVDTLDKINIVIAAERADHAAYRG
jgi:SAM-dependent methyltransferase